MKDIFENDRYMMVDRLVRDGYIKSEKVKQAMLRVPRHLFVPENVRRLAYEDTPLPIGFGQTISAPHMVALMCELADLEIGMNVLEVGTGSGYHAAVIAEIIAPIDVEKRKWGHVFTIERIPELAKFARENLTTAGYSERVTVIVGDGTKGYAEKSPYDRIIVTAAAPSIPKPLIDQLKVGGKLIIPVGDRFLQYLYVVEKKSEQEVSSKAMIPCLFVPLVGEHGWKNSAESYERNYF